MNSPAASRRRARGFSGCSGANLQKSTNRHKLITSAQLPVAPHLKVAARDQNAPHRPISLPALPYRGQLNWTDELGSPSDGLITPHLMPGPRKLVLHRDPDPPVRSRRNPTLAKSRRIGVQPTPNRAAFGQGGTATCLKALNSRTFSQDWSKYPTCALRTGRKSSCILHPGLDSCGFIRTRKIGCTPAAVKSRSKRMNPALLLFAHARFGAQVGYFDHNRKNVRVRCPRPSISMQEGREFAHKYT